MASENKKKNVVQNIFTEGLSMGLEDALQYRIDANSMILPDKINEFILYKNGKMPWVKLQSSVDHIGDIADTVSIAQRWVLRSLFTTKGTSFVEYEERNQLEAYNYNEEYGYRPLPGIESVSVTTLQPLGSLRQATINYKCWTKGQLENLERLYMRPGFSCLLEWGWSYYLDDELNLQTLTDGIDYFDTTQTERSIINKISQIKEDTNYHYDGMIGFVKNFSWKLRQDGGYDCSTTLISKGELISSMTANVSSYALDTKKSPISNLNKTSKVYGMFTFDKLTNKNLAESKLEEDLDETPAQTTETDGNGGQSSYASMLNYQYSKSILSGVFYELAAFSDITNKGIGYQKFKATNSDFPSSNPIMVLSMKLKNDYSVDISRKEGSVGNYKFGSDTEKKFIYLKDFIRIINNYAVFHYKQRGKKTAEPIFRIISSRIRSKYHPLVISSNYDVCFVRPSALVLDKMKELASSDETVKEVQDEIKEFTNYLTEDFGAGQDYQIHRYGDSSNQYADSGNVLINLHFLYSKINDVLLQNESDSKKDGGINLSSFISSILSEISSNLGGLSDLQLIYDDTNGICKIVDRNLLVDISNMAVPTFKIPIFGEKSIVKNVGVESRIFAEQATMISIAAQVGGGTQYGFDSTVMGIYNDGLTDRFFTHKDHKLNLKTKGEVNIKQEEEKEAEFNAMTEAGAKYVDYFLKNMPDDSKSQRPGSVLDTSYLKNMLRFVEGRNHSNLSAKNARILPINLGLTFDGISGFLIGNILNLDNNVIPEPFANRVHASKNKDPKGIEELYKEYIRDIDYYFAVTGIDHSITTSGWLTSLKTNYVLRNKDSRVNKSGTQFSLKDQVNKVFQGDIVVMGFGASTLQEFLAESLQADEKLPPAEKITDVQLQLRIRYFAELFRELNKLNINNRKFSKWDIIVIMGNIYTESGATFDPFVKQIPVLVGKGKTAKWSGAGWGLIQFDTNAVRQPLFGTNGIGKNWNIRSNKILSSNGARDIFDFTEYTSGYLSKRYIISKMPYTFQDVKDIVKHFETFKVYDRAYYVEAKDKDGKPILDASGNTKFIPKANAPHSTFNCLPADQFNKVIAKSQELIKKYDSKKGELGFSDEEFQSYTFEIEYIYQLFVSGEYKTTPLNSTDGDDSIKFNTSYNNILNAFAGKKKANNLAIRNDKVRTKNCQRVKDLINNTTQLDGNSLDFDKI